MRQPLRFGPLLPPGQVVTHSGLRWLRANGEDCPAGSIIAYCNLGLMEHSDRLSPLPALASERRDLQLALVLRQPGRLHYKPEFSAGGQLDQLEWSYHWRPEVSFAELETNAPPEAEGPLRQLFISGRRATELAEVRDGPLTGWHDRKRAWWGDGTAPAGLLLGLGSCELTAVMLGSRPGLLDLLAGRPAGAQVAVVPDIVLIPCARTTLEQLQRSPEQAAAIRADLAAGLLAAGGGLTAADWHYAGAIQAALLASPLNDPCPIVLRSGLHPVARPDAVVMSLLAEPQQLLRHKRLGYSMALYDFRLADAGPALRRWLRDSFEPQRRSPEDIAADFAALAAALRGTATRHLLVANIFSSAIHQDLPGYAGLDLPLHQSVAHVWNKEINLALADLATQESTVAVVDVDALSTEMGAAWVLPDGVHVSGLLQQAMQQEIRRLLALRGVPGFG